MLFIVEENCYNIDAVNCINPVIKPFLDKVIDSCKISSLDYFVIADSTEQNYRQAVIKYASLVDTDAETLQDGVYFVAGKSLDGIDMDGNLHQAIVIKSSVWVCAAIEYGAAHGIFENDIQKQMTTPSFMSLALILHEIGHAVDNEHQLNINGTINTKLLYNLDYEYDEYAKYSALSLWGEYYAESFAYGIIQSPIDITKEKEIELENCIKKYSIGIDRNTLIERVYRILYFFVLRIAYIHRNSNFQSTFDYDMFEKDELLQLYIPILARTEIAIINLFRNYPRWGSYECLSELSAIFKKFVSFEAERQKLY
jgi:hypothetical protein